MTSGNNTTSSSTDSSRKVTPHIHITDTVTDDINPNHGKSSFNNSSNENYKKNNFEYFNSSGASDTIDMNYLNSQLSSTCNSESNVSRKRSFTDKLKSALLPSKIEETFGNKFSVSASAADRRRRQSVESTDSILSQSPKTLEKPPMIDFYQLTKNGDKSKSRPTIVELMCPEKQPEESIDAYQERNTKIIESQLKPKKKGYGKTVHIGDKDIDTEKNNNKTNPKKEQSTKYGWIIGVLVRCTANIFGAMLYLRMGWFAGQAGIIMGSCIVLLAALVTTITALSMSAICTNGQVKGGGAYYLISRSLGPEFGGSIGIIFSLANTVGAAMYAVGFSEITVAIMQEHGWSIIDGGLNDIRLIGLISAIILITIIFISLSFESYLQLVLLIIVFITIGDLYIGSIFKPTADQRLQGMTGYSLNTFTENLYPSFRQGHNFFSVFAIYFPAATGIMAGANISGDLKNPAKAIPKGTLLAIGITTVFYLTLIWLMGASVVRDADGVHLPVILNVSKSVTSNGWYISSAFSKAFGSGTQYYAKPLCTEDFSCKYGLMNYFRVFELIAYFRPLVTIGILGSTLSSTLLCLVSGPKIFQAVCHDKIFPYINIFAKTYGKDKEPRPAYIFTFLIACCVIMIGDLNKIAPIISNFFLCTYTLLNFACFDISLVKSPGFRPSFKYYNKWISLAGSILSITVMFVISWLNALLTFMFFGVLFLYMKHRKPDVNWGSSTQAHSYRHALQYVQKLENTDEHVKNYRPQILVLSGNPATRPSLVDFAYAVTKGNSLLVCGHVVPYHFNESVNQMMANLREQVKKWFNRRRVKSFYFPIANVNFRQGSQNLIQSAGLSRLKPNIILIGFKQNWYKDGMRKLDELNDYFGVIQDSFASQLAVCVLRNSQDGLDFADIMNEHNHVSSNLLSVDNLNHRSSTRSLANLKKGKTSVIEVNKVNFNLTPDIENSRKIVSTDQRGYESESCSSMSESNDSGIDNNCKNYGKNYTEKEMDIIMSLNKFNLKVKRGVIDVWWLYDDGGLTLLIPYLLTQQKSYLEKANLRVFTVSANSKKVEEQEKNLAALLAKFRINCAEVTVLPDISGQPNQKTMTEFNQLIDPFYYEDDSKEDKKDGLISKSELISQQDRTWRSLRTAEYLQKYSKDSNLIVITLPVPRKGQVGSCLYLSWLEMMSKNLPPVLFVRGNQQSVLTFYS